MQAKVKQQCVREGNLMVARCSLLMALAWAKQICTVLEQPRGSLMPRHPSLAWLISVAARHPQLRWYEVNTFMGAFNAATLKPTTLWSTEDIYVVSRP